MIRRLRLLELYYQVHLEADNKILSNSKGGHGNNLDILSPFRTVDSSEAIMYAQQTEKNISSVEIKMFFMSD